jgi:hypothetical protein
MGGQAAGVKHLRIAVYAIAKDEQKHVHRFMDSVADADIVVVGVDPGDTTGDILEARGAIVHRIDLPQFRFDHYRNEVLKRVPANIDVCVSLDLDEILQPGWRQEIERVWERNTTRLHYRLKWDPNRDDWFYYDRIHHRHGYVWRHANHEAVYAQGIQEVVAQSDLTVEQHPDTSKDRSKNLELLRMAAIEEPGHPRMHWYLARELFSHGQLESAVEVFHYYFKLRSKWPIEVCWACIFVSQALQAMGEMHAEAWLHSAIYHCPDSRDGYFMLAQLHADLEEWELAAEVMHKAKLIACDTHNFMHKSGAYGLPFWELMLQVSEHTGDQAMASQAQRRIDRLRK